jgi:hypothetical protein
MMGAISSVLDLVEAARSNAKASEARISELRQENAGAELQEAVTALELVAVDIFSVFEARMQHHFKRGPFSRKLKQLLVDSGETDLAYKLHSYYLAINVLKHGKGASYREMVASKSPFLADASGSQVDGDDAPRTFVDVNVPGFFDGLTETILQAYHFLNRK